MRVFKHHGMRQPGVYLHEVVGYNYRLTNVQSAIGCAQFERIGEFLEKRKKNDSLYRKLLKNIQGVSFQPIRSGMEPAYWFFNILVSGNVDSIRKYLSDKGIETRPLFVPLHEQKAYVKFTKNKKFPVADKLHKFGLTLPSSPKLKNKDIEYIAKSIKESLR